MQTPTRHSPSPAWRALRQRLVMALLTGAWLSAQGAWARQPATGIDVVDSTGRTIHLEKPARHIVSLAPHITENLFAIGAGQQIAGVISGSNYPEAAPNLPQVGQFPQLDFEAIALLQPDLIIAWQSSLTPSLRRQLEKIHAPLFVTEAQDIPQIAASLIAFGQLTGREKNAERAARALHAGWQQIQRQSRQRKKLTVFYQLWPQPLMTVGPAQLIHQVIAACGGQNVFGEINGLAPVVSQEAALAANPEVIVIGDSRNENQAAQQNWQRWPQLNAVKHQAIYSLPPDLLQRPTLRLLDGANALCQAFEDARQRYKSGS